MSLILLATAEDVLSGTGLSTFALVNKTRQTSVIIFLRSTTDDADDSERAEEEDVLLRNNSPDASLFKLCMCLPPVADARVPY